MIWQTPEWVLFPLICLIFLICLEAGFRLGRRSLQKSDTNQESLIHIHSMQSALLGLLALLLGFTFAMAISRYDDRRELVAAEANAIGTAYMRTAFLSSQARKEIAPLFVDYVDSRLDFYNSGIDAELLSTASKKTADILNHLWDASAHEARKSNNPPLASLYINALNEMIDVNEERQSAFENHVPEAVVFLLFLTSAVSIGFVSYSCGMNGRRMRGPNFLLAVTIACVLTVVLDVDRPRRGAIQVNQSSMERVAEYIKSGKMQPILDSLSDAAPEEMPVPESVIPAASAPAAP